MNVAKYQAVHAVIGGAPRIVSVMSDGGVSLPRYFSGTGPPTSSTLPAGNGKYNASKSGFVISVNLASGGTSYAVGDVLTIVGGTGTALQITVDAVVGGVITDWHVSRIGSYTAYPANTASTTGGTGTGATFNLNFPQPDFYIDNTHEEDTTRQVDMWICVKGGTNATSVWFNLSGCP